MSMARNSFALAILAMEHRRWIRLQHRWRPWFSWGSGYQRYRRFCAVWFVPRLAAILSLRHRWPAIVSGVVPIGWEPLRKTLLKVSGRPVVEIVKRTEQIQPVMSEKIRTANQAWPVEARKVYRILFFFSQQNNWAVSHGRKVVPLTAVAGKVSSSRSFNDSASPSFGRCHSQILTSVSLIHNDHSRALLLLWKG